MSGYRVMKVTTHVPMWAKQRQSLGGLCGAGGFLHSWRGVSFEAGALHAALHFGVFHEGVPDEIERAFSAMSMVMPVSMPITSLSYQSLTGLKALTKPYWLQALG